MPEYRTGAVKGGSQFAGVSKFLNLKRVFDDAVRQNQWKMQQDAMQSQSSMKTAGINQGTYLPTRQDFNLPGSSPHVDPSTETAPGWSNQQSSENMEVPEGMEIAGYSSQGKPYLRKLPKLTEGESKAITNAESLTTQINDLKAILQEDATTGFMGSMRKAQFPGIGNMTSQGQRYRLIRGDIADRLLRLRSGAQINETEFRRLNNLLPKIFRREDVDLEQLDKFENEFNGIRERILTGRVGEMKKISGQSGPSVGMVEDGYRFKGGDPSKPTSWEKVR